MTTAEYLEEVNPWEAQVARSDLAAQKLNLEEGLWKILRSTSREIIVHIPVQLDDGRPEKFTGFRAPHSLDRGRRRRRDLRPRQDGETQTGTAHTALHGRTDGAARSGKRCSRP